MESREKFTHVGKESKEIMVRNGLACIQRHPHEFTHPNPGRPIGKDPLIEQLRNWQPAVVQQRIGRGLTRTTESCIVMKNFDDAAIRMEAKDFVPSQVTAQAPNRYGMA